MLKVGVNKQNYDFSFSEKLIYIFFLEKEPNFYCEGTDVNMQFPVKWEIHRRFLMSKIL